MRAATQKRARTIPHALTVDLEEYFQVSNFDRVIPRTSWDSMPSRVEGQVDRLLDLFDETESRATFFALGWVAERRPALLRRIRDRGHEIASHGYGHELVYEIGPERFREDVRRSRAVIEDAIGERVLGYRAPSFSITKRSLWALEILAEEGFEYDSSIFPVFHPRYGISGFRSEPVGINLGSGRTIAEFPLTTLKWKKWALPLAGGAYLRLLPKALFEWGWQRLDRLDAPSVLYTHPWEIDFDQPRQLVGWRVRVNHYLNLKRTLSRLSEIVGTCRFATMRESLGALAARGHLPQETLGLLVSGAAA